MHQVGGELTAAMESCKYADKHNIQIEINYKYNGIKCCIYDNWKTNIPFIKHYKNFIKPYIKNGIVTFNKTILHKNLISDNLA